MARKLDAFVALSEAELAALGSLYQRRRVFVAGRDLVHQGRSDQAAYILLSGWACSYKILLDGQRQIVDFQLPGDFLGLRSVLLHTSDHSVEAVSDIEVTEFRVADLLNAFTQTPRLATAVLWAVSRDEAMVVEHLVGHFCFYARLTVSTLTLNNLAISLIGRLSLSRICRTSSR